MFKIFRKTAQEEHPKSTQKPVEEFSDALTLLHFFKETTGIDFSQKEEIVRRKLIHFCRERGFFNFESFLTNIKADSDLLQDLINHLTVNESYFYREFHQIASLVEKVKNSTEKVRILCIPSSTGEEPYSIAIAFLEAHIPKERFEIIGIDINSQVIEQAKKGIYSQRDLYKVPPTVQKRYFSLEKEYYHLSNEIRQFVSFHVMSLFEDAFFTLGKFDYIFSRNMLIYFDAQTKMEAKSRIESLLKDPETSIFWGHADMV